MSDRVVRVLHCPETVAGNAQQLAASERELGLRSWAVAMQRHPFGYRSDEFLCEPGAGALARWGAKLRLLRRAMHDFDVVHFNFGQTLLVDDTLFRTTDANGAPLPVARRAVRAAVRKLLAYRDLQLLHRAGKGIVVTVQGDDARQGDYSRAHFPITFATEVDESYYSPEMDAIKRGRIGQFGRYADRIYALNPDLLHVLPEGARFLPYSHIDLRDWQPTRSGAPQDAPPVVVHAPSHRGVKGTRFIMAAVERLQAEGLRFEFRLLEGLRHEDARREYERADLLVDQLLAGWYGGLAVELMALGKPVLCYLREADLGFLPDAMRREMPIIEATPDSIHAVLREWLTTRRGELAARGAASRRYVERWHDPLAIARTTASDYRAILRAHESGDGRASSGASRPAPWPAAGPEA